MELWNFRTFAVVLIVVIALVAIYHATKSTGGEFDFEGFASDPNNNHPITRKKPHVLRDAHKALDAATQELTTRVPQYNLVNKREIILKQTPITVGSTDVELAMPGSSGDALVYAPFGFGSTDSFPVTPDVKVLYRIYAIYSDSMASEGTVKITIKFLDPTSWGPTAGTYVLDLPRTAGNPLNQRDGYSKFFSMDDLKASSVTAPSTACPTCHARIYGRTSVDGSTSGIHRLYIETWHVS